MRTGPLSQRVEQVSGWPVRLISFQLDDEWICVADNVDPGATIARARSQVSREEAEGEALRAASERLSRTRVQG